MSSNVLAIENAMRLMLTKDEINEWLGTLGPYSDACEENGDEGKAILARSIIQLSEKQGRCYRFDVECFITKNVFDRFGDIDFNFGGAQYREAWLDGSIHSRFYIMLGQTVRLANKISQDDIVHLKRKYG